jgi:hypothetical protein
VEEVGVGFDERLSPFRILAGCHLKLSKRQAPLPKMSVQCVWTQCHA